MTITEKQFQTMTQCGGIALAICAVASLYLVLRYRELYRDRVQTDTQFQRMAVQRQALEAVVREFYQRAGRDPKVVEILQRYQLVGAASGTGTNQVTESKP